MTTNDLPFGWQTGNPPAPGMYETIRIISKVTDSGGCATYTIRRVAQKWNGSEWDKFEPDGWRYANAV